MPFEKGRSGNPSGRPKKTNEDFEIQQACRLHGETALGVLVDVMQNGTSEANRLKAALAILERGYGKPEQPITGSDGGNLVIEVVRLGTNPNTQ